MRLAVVAMLLPTTTDGSPCQHAEISVRAVRARRTPPFLPMMDRRKQKATNVSGTQLGAGTRITAGPAPIEAPDSTPRFQILQGSHPGRQVWPFPPVQELQARRIEAMQRVAPLVCCEPSWCFSRCAASRWPPSGWLQSRLGSCGIRLQQTRSARARSWGPSPSSADD